MFLFFQCICPLAQLPRPVTLIYTAGGLQTYIRSMTVIPTFQQLQTSEDS